MGACKGVHWGQGHRGGGGCEGSHIEAGDYSPQPYRVWVDKEGAARRVQ